jgi:hypothetical protein
MGGGAGEGLDGCGEAGRLGAGRGMLREPRLPEDLPPPARAKAFVSMKLTDKSKTAATRVSILKNLRFIFFPLYELQIKR